VSQPVRAQDLISLMTGKNGSKGGVYLPGQGRLRGGNPENGFKVALQIFQAKGTMQSVKLRMASELYPNLEQVEVYLRERLNIQLEQHQEAGKSLKGKAERKAHESAGKKILKEGEQYIRETFILLRLHHFQTVSDQVFNQGRKFSFLVQGLRELANRSGTEEEKAGYEELLDSVEIKQWEIARVHAEAESFIADFRGTKKRSKFTGEEYPALKESYQGFLRRMEKYSLKNPDISKILEAWDGGIASQRPEALLAEDLIPLIKKLDIPTGDRRFFQKILTHDPVLSMGQYVPLHRILRNLERGVDVDQYPELWNPIGRYIRALKDLDPWTTPQDFARLKPRMGSDKGDQEAALKNLKSLLKEEIADRVGTEKEHSGDAFQAVEDYISKAAPLLDHLRFHRPQLRALPADSWVVIRKRLVGRSRKGFLSEQAVK